MRVLLQLRPSPDVVAAVADPSVSTAAADVAVPLPGVVVDPSFSPVVVPRPVPDAGGDPWRAGRLLLSGAGPPRRP
ncbi:hypothetical protein [Streptosporangium sp. CA-115845]|uniref:hypothetical protein n=1 Tax=Streptosporangium sp. CA-115845 TaxID=3240071 RepID=UPI003D89E965